MNQFHHERRAHTPSRPAIAIQCRMCGEVTTARILMRRVIKHLEQLQTPVRVTITRKCPCCRSVLSTRVRIDMDRSINYEAINTQVVAFGKRR